MSRRLAVSLTLAFALPACAHDAASSPATTSSATASRPAAAPHGDRTSPPPPAASTPPTPGLRRVATPSAVPARGRCGVLEDFRATGSVPMLGGRFRLPSPADVRMGPRDAGEVAGGVLVRQSLAYVQRGTLQLTVIAQELLRLPGDDLEGYAIAEDQGDFPIGEVATVSLGGGLEAVVVESTDPTPKTGNLFLAHAFVKTPEGTLASFAFVVTSTQARMDAPSCRPLVRQVLTQLAPGAQRLDVDGGTRTIGRFLSLDVPPGYAVEEFSSPDEQILTLERIHARDAPTSTLRIASTLHPPNIENPIDRMGPYLGRSVAWRDGYTADVVTRTAILHIPGRPEYAFTTAEAASVDEVHALMDLAGTIRVRR